MKAVWPRPSPPDWDHDNGRPYPFHLLHHKFREWQKRPVRGSDLGLIKPDIVDFLQCADDGHKGRFYSWLWFNKLTDAERKSVGDKCPDRFAPPYEYRWSSASALYKLHQFFVYIRCYMCTPWLAQIHYFCTKGRPVVGPEAVRPLFGSWGARLIVRDKADVKMPEVVTVDASFLPEGVIPYFFSALTEEEQKQMVGYYDHYMHPKEADRKTVRPPPAETQLSKQERLQRLVVEALVRTPADGADEVLISLMRQLAMDRCQQDQDAEDSPQDEPADVDQLSDRDPGDEAGGEGERDGNQRGGGEGEGEGESEEGQAEGECEGTREAQ